MDTQLEMQETYKGFVIKANARQMGKGYVSGATVSRMTDDSHKEFNVHPPAVTHRTKKGALTEAIFWGKDLVDVLNEDIAHGKFH